MLDTGRKPHTHTQKYNNKGTSDIHTSLPRAPRHASRRAGLKGHGTNAARGPQSRGVGHAVVSGDGGRAAGEALDDAAVDQFRP
jgi:hypothetical protein